MTFKTSITMPSRNPVVGYGLVLSKLGFRRNIVMPKLHDMKCRSALASVCKKIGNISHRPKGLVLFLLLITPTFPPYAICQEIKDNSTTNFVGTWQGILHVGRDLRVVFKLSQKDGSAYQAVNYSIDQGGAPFPVSRVTIDGTTVKMLVPQAGGEDPPVTGAAGLCNYATF